MVDHLSADVSSASRKLAPTCSQHFRASGLRSQGKRPSFSIGITRYFTWLRTSRQSAFRLPLHPVEHPLPRHVIAPIDRRRWNTLRGHYNRLASVRIGQLLEHPPLLLHL